MRVETEFCDFEFTPLAVERAVDDDGLQAVVDRFIVELADCFENSEIEDLFVLTVNMHDSQPNDDDDDRDAAFFVAWPISVDTLQVDSARFEYTEPLTKGRFAGKKIKFPLPASGIPSPLRALATSSVDRFENEDGRTVLIDSKDIKR